MSFANSEVLPSVAGYFRPILGRDPYNKKNVEDALARTYKVADVLEQHLLVNTFLVGERLTLADLFAAAIVSRGFEFVFDKKFRDINTNITRWYTTIVNQEIYKAVIPEVKLIDEILKNVAPKSDKPKAEKAPAKPKEAPKPKAPEPEEEDEAPAAPKAKHPLESLEKPTLILDDWKRKYSNEETREVALPWFWENYKPEEYSLWAVDYKYNDELTQTFMSSNLIGTCSPLLFLSLKIVLTHFVRWFLRTP